MSYNHTHYETIRDIKKNYPKKYDFSPAYPLRERAKSEVWYCEYCDHFVQAGALCPDCNRNRVLLMAEGEAQYLVEYIDQLEEIIRNLTTDKETD